MAKRAQGRHSARNLPNRSVSITAREFVLGLQLVRRRLPQAAADTRPQGLWIETSARLVHQRPFGLEVADGSSRLAEGEQRVGEIRLIAGSSQ